MRTIAQAISSARLTLNDIDSTRYADSEMLGYMIDGLNTVKNIRPDLFLGNYADLGTLTTASNIPVNEMFFRPLTDYIIARCEMKDDESVVDSRAELMVKLASGFLA